MPKQIQISDRMANSVRFISREAGVTEDQALVRIFAIAEAVYMNSDDNDVKVTDSKNTFNILGIRNN